MGRRAFYIYLSKRKVRRSAHTYAMTNRDIEPRKGDTEIMLKHALEVDRTLLSPDKRNDPDATWKDLHLVQENVGIHFSRGEAGVRCELDSDCKLFI